MRLTNNKKQTVAYKCYEEKLNKSFKGIKGDSNSDLGKVAERRTPSRQLSDKQ